MISYQNLQIFSFTLCTLISTSFALEAIEVAQIPQPISYQSAHYDEPTDTVYLFGGLVNATIINHDVYAFSLSTNTVRKVGEIPNHVEYFTKTHVIRSSKSDSSHLLLYYILPQSYEDFTFIYLFNATDGTASQVAILPISLELSSLSQAPNGELYFFGGPKLEQNILKLDLDSGSEVIWEFTGTLIHQYFDNPPFIATIENTAFIFGGRESSTFSYITVNLDSLESSDPQSLLPPFKPVVATVVATNEEIYISGGYYSNADQIIQMNATSQSYRSVSINNNPLEPDAYWIFAPIPVWIESLNRIYFFGGTQARQLSIWSINTIWYVEV